MEPKRSRNDNQNNEKIERVLEKFLDPDFKIRNDVYLNLFLTHLIGKNDGKTVPAQTDERQKEQFCQWIIRASTLWSQKEINPKPAILSFALNLASRQSADEEIFVKLNLKNAFESLVEVSQKSKDPSVTLGVVTLLCSFLEHKSGLQWVMATTHWTDIINLSLTAHTMYIRKKSYRFVIKLLEKTISFNRHFGMNIVGMIVKPLKDALRTLPNNEGAQDTNIRSKELYQTVKATLDLILEVTEPLLKNFNKPVFQLFLAHGTPEVIEKFVLLSRDEDFSYHLLQIKFVFYFHKMYWSLGGVKKVSLNEPSASSNCTIVLDLILDEMKKGYVKCAVKICHFAHELFCCLEHRMPTFTQKGNVINFAYQIVSIQVTPVFALSYQLWYERRLIHLLDNDILRQNFFFTWLKQSSVQQVEVCFRCIDILKEKPDLVDDIIFCLQYIGKMKPLLVKERASFVFTVFVYALSDGIKAMKEFPDFDLKPSCLVFFRTLVENIVDFVKSFDLTWKDSMEAIHIMELACDLLHIERFSDHMMVIQGLKLLNTAIANYMSPDTVLLIDENENSKVTGDLLYAKCHDSFWEVRDSALEVIWTLSLNAKSKFPAYKNILLNPELPQLVVIMTLKDGEYYVRATAFKCLQELVQIPEVWDIFSNIDNFLGNMLDVFANETEGIVRKEAAILIYKIQKFQGFPEEILPRLYDVMTHAAIGDLHWEVKYSALDFWFHLWEQHLIQQGMIDGAFPSHTFSKEHKKIVALNEIEVRKRIIKVLNQLSDIGYLYIMKCAVQDDCDIEVSKKASDFTLDMLKMFKNYKIPSENVDLSQPSSPESKQQESSSRQPLIEPVSSTDPSMMYPSHYSTNENLGTPQFPYSPYFDPVSPYIPPPSFDINRVTSPNPTIHTLPYQSIQSSPAGQDQSSCESSIYPRTSSSSGDSSYQNSPISALKPYLPINKSSVHIISDITISGGNNTCIGDGDSFETVQMTNQVNSSKFDSVQTEALLEDFLDSNDVTLLQEIYNPTDQITNNTTQMKTKTYLAPSQYLQFVYNEVETHTAEKTLWLNSFDEFDSLLDDILKEYNVVADINNMDCY